MDYQAARAINLPSPEGDWWCHRGQKAQGPHGTRAAAELWAGRHGGGYEIEQSVWAQRAGGNRIRKEITLMVRILTDAHLWGQEQELGFLRLRPEESDVARAMTIAEQHRFLHVSASRLAFRTIYQYAIVALQTTASPNELRELRLCDVLLDDRIIQVPPAGAKNPYRFRAIPLVTEDAMWALEGLLERARVLGSKRPTDHLFPLRVKRGDYDPSKPMSESGLKKQWDQVRIAAGMPRLRMYDLRHTGITRMAEAGVPLAVAMTFAGHMTVQMQQRYTAVCMASQRGWGATVWGDGRAANGAPLAGSQELAAAWPARKPVASEKVTAYQNEQQIFKRG